MKRWLQKFMQAQTPEVAKDILGVAASQGGGDLAAHEAAADPHPGYALEADLGDAAALDVGTSAGTVAAGDDSRLSDDRVAAGIRTATTVVLLNSATAPTAGQVITAIDDENADWQDPDGGGDVVYSDSPNDTINVNVTVAPATLVAKSLTIAARDVIECELWGTLLNNSGANRTYTPRVTLTVGANTLELTPSDAAAVAAHATNRMWWRIKAWISVATTSATQGLAESYRASASTPANTAASPATSSIRHAWNTTANDMTGSATLTIDFKSDNTTATQQFVVYGYRVSQRAQAV